MVDLIVPAGTVLTISQPSPSPREGHAMQASVATNYGDQVTLYGGQASQALLGDIWRLEDRSKPPYPP